MILKKVTLTGADNTVNPKELFKITKQFPFVEWGILVSKSSMGQHRFPSEKWLCDLYDLDQLSTIDNLSDFSFHFCGKWVRDICSGHWYDIEPIIKVLISETESRTQLNFHCYEHLINEHFYPQLRNNTPSTVIFQVDGKNDHLCSKAHDAGIAAYPLFDKSGGNGIVPDSWPKQTKGIYTGYAGGLGPDNLEEELEKISEACDSETPIWIDMESKLYTGVTFDLEKCVKVLEICKKYIKD